MDGDVLAGEKAMPKVLIKASIEDLIAVRAKSILELLKAAYHLGNRHVELELHPNQLFFLDDPVLTQMLNKRQLNIEKVRRPFFPEQGAYQHF